MMILPVLLFILILYVIFRDTGFTRKQRSTSNERSPLEILNQRYAEGTLVQDEFFHMRDELSKNT